MMNETGNQPDEAPRQYYAYGYKFDSSKRFLIWYSDEKDGVFTDTSGMIPSFQTVAEAADFSIKQEIEVDLESPAILDLDKIINWMNAEYDGQMDRNLFFEAWNLFDDISRSTDGNFDSDKEKTNKIFDKLFWGCNLPSMTPEGEHYQPEWDAEEFDTVFEIMRSGLNMFRKSVRPQ